MDYKVACSEIQIQYKIQRWRKDFLFKVDWLCGGKRKSSFPSQQLQTDIPWGGSDNISMLVFTPVKSRFDFILKGLFPTQKFITLMEI